MAITGVVTVEKAVRSTQGNEYDLMNTQAGGYADKPRKI